MTILTLPAFAKPLSGALWRHGRRWARNLLLAALILLTLLLLVDLVWYAYATHDLAAARREVAAAGLSLDQPVSPPCPDADNAALCYENAYAALSRDGYDWSNQDFPHVPGEWVPQRSLDPRLIDVFNLDLDMFWDTTAAATRERARRVLFSADYDQAWVQIALGARRPRCVFFHHYSDTPGFRMFEYGMLEDLSNLGKARALFLIDAGRIQDGLDLLTDLLCMERRQTWANLQQTGDILRIVNTYWNRGTFAHADCTRMEAALADEDMRPVLTRGLDTGAWFGECMFRQYDAGINPGIIGDRLYQCWLCTPMRRSDEARYLRILAADRLDVANGNLPDPVGGLWGGAARSLAASFAKSIRHQQFFTRVIHAARLALLAHRGGSPTPVPGIVVARDPDQPWKIRTASADPDLPEEERTWTWIVPAPAAPAPASSP